MAHIRGGDMRTKELFYSPYVARLLHGIKSDMEQKGLTDKDLAGMSGYSIPYINKLKRRVLRPSNEMFVFLGKMFHWNIQDEPNYLFFTKRYSYDWLLQRLMGCGHSLGEYLLFSGVKRDKLMQSLTYGEYGGAPEFGRFVVFLHEMEKRAGYPAPLNILYD